MKGRSGTGALERRLAERWRAGGWTRPGDRVLVAFSGGLDSLVLLHLLRFGMRGLDVEPVAAHFDHRMRRGSEAEARWARGLAGAWGVDLRLGRADAPPTSEAEARTLRYEFLWRVRADTGARCLVTAHHADDQVETILFRLLRGSGVEGLAGMPRCRAPGLLRPLLDEPRDALEDYAARMRLTPRFDPSNLDRSYARNRLRHEVLPALERVHPGARGAILRAGRNAGRTAEALDHLLGGHVEAAVIDRGDGVLELDRGAVVAHPPPVRRALLRAVLRDAGIRLGEAGTEAAIEFISTGSSGRRLHLPEGVRMSRDFDTIRLWRSVPESRLDPDADRPGQAGGRLEVPDAQAGAERVRFAGRTVDVVWGPGDVVPGSDDPRGEDSEEGDALGDTATFDPTALLFPLTVRAREPGDRVRGRGGSRKLKKLLGELRVPRGDRARLPLVLDARGEVIWIPGLHRAPVALPREGAPTWTLRIRSHDTSR